MSAMPTGTLMKKIHDQASELVRKPPSSTPAAAPLPETAPQTPSAMLRSRTSANVVVRIESAGGGRAAPPRPWVARKVISEPADQAKPAARELSVKRAIPAMKNR